MTKICLGVGLFAFQLLLKYKQVPQEKYQAHLSVSYLSPKLWTYRLTFMVTSWWLQIFKNVLSRFFSCSQQKFILQPVNPLKEMKIILYVIIFIVVTCSNFLFFIKFVIQVIHQETEKFIKNMVSRFWLPRFKSQFCHSVDLLHWES